MYMYKICYACVHIRDYIPISLPALVKEERQIRQQIDVRMYESRMRIWSYIDGYG